MSKVFKTPTKCGLTLIKLNARGDKTFFHLFDEAASNDYSSWYPASTVKFVAAVLAAKRLSDLGFEDANNINITFHYSEGEQNRTWKDLIDKALRPSKNMPYNELVILGGHALITKFLIGHGYDIALNKPYLKAAWKKLTGLNPASLPSYKHTFAGCRITVTDTVTNKTETIPAARAGSYRLDSSRSSSCSTKALAEFLSDFVINNTAKFNINSSLYESICESMSARKSAGMENLVDAVLSKIDNSDRYDVYHKPGFLTTIKESDGNNYTYWCDTVLLHNKSQDGNSYAFSTYGGEKKSILSSIGKNSKIDKQRMLNSNYYPDAPNHLGISDAIGRFINEQG